MSTDAIKPIQQRLPLIVICSFLLITLNVAGDMFALAYHLPVWLDTFGTMIAGFFFGPLAGGAVGLISHILICLKDHSNTWLYAFANMGIGVAVAVSRRKGYLNDLFGFCNVAVLLTLISVFVSFPDTLLLKGNIVGNTWGNSIADFLRAAGLTNFFAILLGELFTDFVDKVVLMDLLYFMNRMYRRLRDNDRSPVEWMSLPNFLVLPIVAAETVIRNRFHGDFTESTHFKNYIILILILLFVWFVWFVSTGLQLRSARKHERELNRLKDRTELFQSMVMTIARLVDAKDIYTAKHSARVTKYSLMIGERMGLGSEEMQNLERAALLHDIGKVAIPDGVLSKKGRLSKEEFQLMRSHPVFGYDILKDLDPSTQIGEGARYHHERYDGSGYPEGLKGEEIPLFGRIIAVADAYDAMSSIRIYRPKCTDEYILGEFRKGRGTQFDPHICDIFIALLEEGKISAENEEHTLTLEKAYERFGGRYVVIRQRLKEDERIREYLGEFLKDGEFGELKRALETGDDRMAFQAVHTLKGISMNLDLVNLEKICIALTENLRDTPINAQTPGLFEQLEKEYQEVCSMIRRVLN